MSIWHNGLLNCGGEEVNKNNLTIVSSQPNIRNTFFDQSATRPPEEGVSRRHKQTDRQTDITIL